MDEHILEGLFRWSHSFVVKDAFGEEVMNVETGEPFVLYQRVIGDAELDMARSTALRASALKRRQLSDPTSLDRLTLIPDYSKIDKDGLIALITIYELPDIRSEASRTLAFPFPEPPKSTATLEEQEEYQEAVDTYFERREEKLQNEVSEQISIRKKALGQRNKAYLRRLYEETAIDAACRDVFLSNINEMMAYLGTYGDPDFKGNALYL